MTEGQRAAILYLVVWGGMGVIGAGLIFSPIYTLLICFILLIFVPAIGMWFS